MMYFKRIYQRLKEKREELKQERIRQKSKRYTELRLEDIKSYRRRYKQHVQELLEDDGKYLQTLYYHGTTPLLVDRDFLLNIIDYSDAECRRIEREQKVELDKYK